jgi:hypothetical protein
MRNKLNSKINSQDFDNDEVDEDNSVKDTSRDLSEGNESNPQQEDKGNPQEDKVDDPQEGKETSPNKEREINNKKEKKVNDLFEKVWNMLPKKDNQSRVKYSQRKMLYNKYGSEILIEAAREFCEDMKSRDFKYVYQASSFFNEKVMEYADRIVKEKNDIVPFTGKFQS